MATSTTKTTTANKAETPAVPEAIDFDANGWRPSPGDILTGELVDVTMGGTGAESFGKYPIITLRKQDSGREVAVHAFHHTLRNRLKEMRPELGHHLTITYFGPQDQVDRDGNPKLDLAGRQKTLEMYEVTSPEFQFNWDAI
jgi:hypothetical protein